MVTSYPSFARSRSGRLSRMQECLGHPLGTRSLLALDWNLPLTTAVDIPDTANAVGIRPHSLVPLSEEDADGLNALTGANLIPVRNPVISALLFEWEICLENGI
ncbi:hypothetical protein V3C10_14375 [[Clostridium] symbiosum]|uniref:hypothetical protein n=1 Tax=Clostridium symbiosum TaxID=1512 RepID=UPI001D06C0C0|nr:hypothetical protein [[Clostridium] symbiosum]MCB6611081.1 hypothetical protein [[Clostridium] symbiosum]MCB6933272.1 hypothetical protein [[Clostridium] symbiosum]